MRTRRRRVLPRGFYDRPTLTVAQALLGKVLVHRRGAHVSSGVIVETEAYIGESDPACHAARGMTRRNAPLYGPPGFSYVYLNYGLHALVNAVTEGQGHPAAVLIRALHPLAGLSAMARRRGVDLRTVQSWELCRGPGNLSKALGITMADNEADLTDGTLVIEDHGLTPGPISWGPRIGIRVGADRPWRCFLTHERAVSGRRTWAAAVDTTVLP